MTVCRVDYLWVLRWLQKPIRDLHTLVQCGQGEVEVVVGCGAFLFSFETVTLKSSISRPGAPSIGLVFMLSRSVLLAHQGLSDLPLAYGICLGRCELVLH